MNKSTKIDLLPCPFCGRVPTLIFDPETMNIRGSVYVKCCNGIVISEFTESWCREYGYAGIREEAIRSVVNKWNTRHG